MGPAGKKVERGGAGRRSRRANFVYFLTGGVLDARLESGAAGVGRWIGGGPAFGRRAGSATVLARRRNKTGDVWELRDVFPRGRWQRGGLAGTQHSRREATGGEDPVRCTSGVADILLAVGFGNCAAKRAVAFPVRIPLRESLAFPGGFNMSASHAL